VDRLTKIKKSPSYIFVTFSTANLNKMLKETSKTDVVKLGIVLGVAAVYGWVAQSGLAALGVIVLASSAAAALGVCSLIGLPINLLSTHVLPFITVGLAMREMFLILSAHEESVPAGSAPADRSHHHLGGVSEFRRVLGRRRTTRAGATCFLFTMCGAGYFSRCRLAHSLPFALGPRTALPKD
jgi:hypothetical protein